MFSFLALAQEETAISRPKIKDEVEQTLAEYLEEYRVTTLDFEKNDLFNYYLAVFLRVAREKKTFDEDLKVALKYFTRATNLNDKERVAISKIVFYSEETQDQSKERILKLYQAFHKKVPGFAKRMAKEFMIHLDKLENDKIKYVTTKGILKRVVSDEKDEALLERYCRLLLARGQFAACYDVVQENRKLIDPGTFTNLQIESFLYEGEIKLAKTLLEGGEADFTCKNKLVSDYDYKLRRNVAIFLRIAGEFKKSLDCLRPLENKPDMAFFYYYDGMKASRSLDKKTTDYLFKRAARLANQQASKFLNTLLDWEEAKNSYYADKFSYAQLNEVINNAEYQKFRPTLLAAENLKQNFQRKSDEIIKHPKLKYLELLDIYWLVTLKTIEKNRQKKKK